MPCHAMLCYAMLFSNISCRISKDNPILGECAGNSTANPAKISKFNQQLPHAMVARRCNHDGRPRYSSCFSDAVECSSVLLMFCQCQQLDQ